MTPDDARLCETDRDLTALPVVLDAEQVAPLLGEPPGSVTATYVRYKPGVSCVVGYSTPRGPAYAHAASARQLDKLEGWAEGKPGVRGAVLVRVGAGGVLLGRPESDPTVPGPARLASDDGEPERGGRVLAELLGRATSDARLVPLRYKPGRRWVARADVDGTPVAVVKAYRPLDAVRARAAARACAPIGPRTLGRSGRAGLAASAWRPGRSLDDLLLDATEADAADDARVTDLDPHACGWAVGTALAALHGSVAADLVPQAGPREPRAAARSAAEAVARILPAEARRAARLAAVVVDGLEALPGAGLVALHGDLGADQVVMTGDGSGARLVDLDQAFAGHPALDLGAFRASVVGLVAGLPPGAGGRIAPSVAGVVRGVEDGYAAARGAVSERALAVCTAAALLRTAVDPFRRREPRWSEAVRAALGAAEAALGGAVVEVPR